MARTPKHGGDENYSAEESQRRFEAALRGSQKAGHVPMKRVSGAEGRKPRPPAGSKKTAK